MTEPLVWQEYLELVRMIRQRIELEKDSAGAYVFDEDPSRYRKRMAQQVTSVAPVAPVNPVASPKPVVVPQRTPALSDVTQTNSEPQPSVSKLSPQVVSSNPAFPSIQELTQQAANCQKCKLSQTRTQVVFGVGSAQAELVIVGEAPGFYEDRDGIPFVGKAGQLLTKMLAAIQIQRQDVYICNVIKCRPPENRDPAPEEIIACRTWLQAQLKALEQPKLICAMGKFACAFLTNIQQSMWKYRGATYEYEGVPVICTYHPAYLLRNLEEKKKAWEDIKRVRRFLDESRK